jgi:hypothetical protein
MKCHRQHTLFHSGLTCLTIWLSAVLVATHATAGTPFYLPSTSKEASGIVVFEPGGGLTGFTAASHPNSKEIIPGNLDLRKKLMLAAAEGDKSPCLPLHSGLSDHIVIAFSPQEFKILRFDYSPYDDSPTNGKMWIGPLDPIAEGKPVFQVPELTSVLIPRELLPTFNLLRKSKPILDHRRRQLDKKLAETERRIAQFRTSEPLLREWAATVRQHGICCTDFPPRSPATEARGAELEAAADQSKVDLATAMLELKSLRAVNALQAAGMSTPSGLPSQQ